MILFSILLAFTGLVTVQGGAPDRTAEQTANSKRTISLGVVCCRPESRHASSVAYAKP